MTQQSKAKIQNFSLAELQQLCDDCQLAINEQLDAAIKQAMLKVCHTCKQVKAHVPELMELRRHIHDMNERLSDTAA
jgi:ribosome-binding protein aMBF1 (putative translation factor)